MVSEASVPWEPIPAHANYCWQVDVFHFEDAFTADSARRKAGASVGIAAYWETPERQVGAWRIDFRNVRAYRRRSQNVVLHPPLTTPDPQVGLACWEIFPSRYVLECLHPDLPWRRQVESTPSTVYATAPLHHYVIVFAIQEVLEVIAASWTSEELPADWAKPFGGPFPRL